MTCPLDLVCGEGTEAHLEYFKYMFKSPCFCAHCFELVIMTAFYIPLVSELPTERRLNKLL